MITRAKLNLQQGVHKLVPHSNHYDNKNTTTKWDAIMGFVASERTFLKIFYFFIFHFEGSPVTYDFTITANGVTRRKSGMCCLVYRDQIS